MLGFTSPIGHLLKKIYSHLVGILIIFLQGREFLSQQYYKRLKKGRVQSSEVEFSSWSECDLLRFLILELEKGTKQDAWRAR